MIAGAPSAPPARRRTAVVAAVAAVALLAAVVVAVRALVPGECSASSPAVAVAADPAVAPVLAPVLGSEQHTDDGTCVQVRVTARRTADVARDIAAGQAPELWVADSTTSVQLALPERGGAAPVAEVGSSLVRSPLVAVAGSDAAARAGWADSAPTWRALLGGQVQLSIADPANTGEGLLSLLSAAATLGPIDPADPPAPVVQSLDVLGRTLLPDPGAVPDGAGTTAAVVTEQAAFARRAAGPPPTVAYPAEGSIPLDYPLVRVRRPAERVEQAAAAGAVAAALRSPEALAALQRAGFRDADGHLAPELLGPGAPAGVAADAPPVLPAPPEAAVQQVLGLWSTLSLTSQMLLVFDVSGSMREPTAAGPPHIEVSRDAALTALSLFEDRSTVGVWAFARDLGPGTDWREVVPIAELTAPESGGTHRQAVQAGVAALPSLVGGGTGLFDTTLAAVRRVRESYRPDVINAVALVTDGRNDDPDGVDLETLVATLRAEAGPATPVPVFGIGIGPDADLGELTAISEATGGQAYRASTAAEIQQVFFDAYARWTCRGAC